MDTTLAATLPRSTSAGAAERAVRWSAAALAWLSLFSAWLFGLYILAFYTGVPDLTQWNRRLPGIYDPATPAATWGIGAHFAAGGIILLLGGLQLVAGVRRRWPALHRWIGRVYVAAALVAGAGGLGFIAARGTIGGLPMDLGFGLYGVLMLLAGVQAYRHARARRLVQHRAWALRLFALAIGSWLYRMEYGFWKMLTDTAGHTKDFTGPFDVFMAFFFYLPNLLVVEAYLRGRNAQASAAARWSAAAALSAAAAFVVMGTWVFTRRYWGPAILARLGF